MKATHTPKPWRGIGLATLLVALALVSAVPPASAGTTRVLAITNASAQPAVPFKAFDGNPPKVYDINKDGRLEIIAQNDNQYVYVFDSLNGELLFEAKTSFPPGWGARSFNGPEVSVLSEDGKVYLVVANSAAVLTAYRFEPAQSGPTDFRFTKVWDRRMNDCHSNPGMDAKPVFADLDKDGRFEILVTTEESGVFALRRDGTLFWKVCTGGGNAEPGVGDLNGDGAPDVVHASDGGLVAAFNGKTGGWLWSYNVLNSWNLGSASMPVGATVAQLDGSGGPEIVVGARDSHDATNWANDHALLLVLKPNGQLLWGRQHPEANPLTYTRPIVVDADKDGSAEVYWGDWNTNGHKPPWNSSDAWKVLGPANFYRYDKAGALVWRTQLDAWWSNKDLALADVDDDGVQEVLANGPSTNGHDGIWYLNANTGAKEAFVDVHPWKVARAPVVADLWGGGTMQWVLQADPNAPEAGGPAILVYDTGVAYDSAWPHVPYPTLGPPVNPGPYFPATFKIKNPNEWWQEVTVHPDQPKTITKVEVRKEGGAWQSMALQNWGAWTSSIHTPAGTSVEFLATASDGGQSQSVAFTWLNGDLEQGSVPPGGQPPPPFQVTYEVPPGVNEWWVEVKAASATPITGVDARVNGGAWTALQLQSWGNWAKSFFVATGSAVQFRATSSTGQQNISRTFYWLSAGGAFNATFEPQAVGNDWWVEVKVTANRPLSKVEANVDNGAWQPLELKSWGNWAKSFFVPNGAEVRFRATSTDGDTATSGPTVWT